MANKNNSVDKGGAPTKYKAVYANQVKQLCLLGLTDKEISIFFGISVSTFNNWKLNHPRLLEALRGSKILADGQVAEGLFKRAIGFNYDEVSYERVSVNLLQLEGESIKVDAWKKKVITKFAVPDVGAQTLWLMNRQKNNWRSKQVDEFENLPEGALDEIIKRLKEKILHKKSNN